MVSFSDNTRVFVVVLLGALHITVVLGAIGDGGSKCADATCTPAPPGVKCEAKYADKDACCPTWICQNGQSVYGMNRNSGFASFASSSFSNLPFGLGNNNLFGGANPLGANTNTNNNNNIFGANNNPFASLFGGNLFGGRRR